MTISHIRDIHYGLPYLARNSFALFRCIPCLHRLSWWFQAIDSRTSTRLPTASRTSGKVVTRATEEVIRASGKAVIRATEEAIRAIEEAIRAIEKEEEVIKETEEVISKTDIKVGDGRVLKDFYCCRFLRLPQLLFNFIDILVIRIALYRSG